MSQSTVPTRRHTPQSVHTSAVNAVECVILLALFAALFVAATAAGGGVGDWPATSRLKVMSGDTAWSIAQAHPVEGLTTAQTVDLIIEMNRIPDSGLVAGSSIQVPLQSGASESVAMR